ncbi:protein-glutamate O-methyltransferase CheR [Paraferrimonas sp. SM1919]|uniref:CheR family methyltransferase n=1 Tax=Paraferrimonas sp. SM1919 TaxID=2662263 RepID=UPI0013D38830|nr:protein-glutamate O-methyltransferase CheR [Paraferrimonas sp. SM1919]
MLQSSTQIDLPRYREFCQYLKLKTGIDLSDNKQYLLNSRLKTLVDFYGLKDLNHLISAVISESNSSLCKATLDAMTTNETLWFRDEYPFELLKRELLPKLNKEGKTIRIWSAACSSGQEPYSIAITLDEYKRQSFAYRLDAQIMATDISHTMLEFAARGQYDALAMSRGMSAQRRKLYFDTVSGADKIKPEYAKNIEFRQQNLLDSYWLLGKFDIIFCRNVLIYFDSADKQRVIKQMAQALQPGGILILGAAEAIGSIMPEFEMIKSPIGIYYRKKGG